MTSTRLVDGPDISARLARTTLTPALRQVAELLLVDPEAIAFGTVASVAERAGTSAPTVVRAATALGYDGFTDLRTAARAELSMRLATDAVRVRSAAPRRIWRRCVMPSAPMSRPHSTPWTPRRLNA